MELDEVYRRYFVHANGPDRGLEPAQDSREVM
jgi:hypothetical protein